MYFVNKVLINISIWINIWRELERNISLVGAYVFGYLYYEI